MTVTATRPRKRKLEVDHKDVVMVRLCDIRPAPENDKLYRPVDPSDPAIIAMAESIRVKLREPLVLSLDRYILSGHRRFAACKLLGWEHVPCRYEPITRANDIDAFIVLLREYNRQRVKSLDEQIREAVIDADPEEARDELLSFRCEKAKVGHVPLLMGDVKTRKEISAAKWEFCASIKYVVEQRREFWPLSDRQIHYAILNNPPLIHSSKPSSRYANDK